MNSYQNEKGAIRKGMTVMFDHEKLDVYQLELRFIAWVTALLEEVAASAKGKIREVCDQLDRASLSALRNTDEGNGKRQRLVRAKFFDDARGSAAEWAGCLDALVAKQAAAIGQIQEGKEMLMRIVSMLCGLVERFDGTDKLHEGPLAYCVPARKDCASRTRTRRKI
jgi:four helix bundle protein